MADGEPVVVTLCELLASVPIAGWPDTLYPPFVRDGRCYSILGVSVPGVLLTREISTTRLAYWCIRDIKPDDLTEQPGLFVDSKPKVVIALGSGQLWTSQ